MSTIIEQEPEITHPHSLRSTKDEVAHWCELYPWYRRLMDDVHATLAARDSHCGNYRVARVEKSTRHYA